MYEVLAKEVGIMIIKATDVKNNFGKYIGLLDKEDIIVTKNGTPVARITKQVDWDTGSRVGEEAEEYRYEGSMTYEEFLELSEKSNDRLEFIDGEVYLLGSPLVSHQIVVGNLYAAFRKWFKGKGCMPFVSPFDVTLKRGKKNFNVVQPDIIVICDMDKRNEEDKYMGTPSLVVEILSKSSRRMDLARKLDLYMATGIKEYWVVNCKKREVLVYTFKDKDIEEMIVYSGNNENKSGEDARMVKSIIFEGLDVKMDDIFMMV